MAGTVELGRVVTKALARENREDRLCLDQNIIFKGNHDQYEIFADQCISFGGESLIYRGERLSDREKIIAKIYDNFTDNPASKKNRKHIIDFLSKHAGAADSNLLPLEDYGYIQIDLEGESYLKPVDILPYCEEGSLKKSSYRDLRNKIIPSILNAMHQMHSAKLVHRDIKPDNLYVFREKVVLGDFGTSGEFYDDKFDFKKTHLKRGTLGYTAPEVWMGYAVVASDYFSLGCTIATLYNGEHVYQRLLESNDEGAINKAIKTSGLPLACPDGEADLQLLVNVLTLMDENRRAGYEDVKLWLENPAAFVKKWKNWKTVDFSEWERPFRFEGEDYINEYTLARAMALNWERAKEYLYRGTIAAFFKPYNQELSVKAEQITEKKETALNHDLGIAQFLYYLAEVQHGNSVPLFWRGYIFEQLSDIGSSIYGGAVEKEKIVIMLQSKFLTWRLQKAENADENMIQALSDIETISEDYPDLGYYIFMYQTVPEGTVQKIMPDMLFENIIKTPEKMNDLMYGIVSSDKNLAYYYWLGFGQAVIEAREEICGDYRRNVECAYRFFDKICFNKKAVRRHYYEYGPNGYLYWMQQHMDMYEYRIFSVQELRKKIEKLVFSEDKSVLEMQDQFLSLKEYQKDFIKNFQGNILLAYFGMQGEEIEPKIVARKSDAFFVEQEKDIYVPVGYKRTHG